MVKDFLESRHPEKYGKITEVILVKKKEGDKLLEEHKGFGFVITDNEDLADRITIGDRKVALMPGNEHKSEFKKAKPKEGWLYFLPFFPYMFWSPVENRSDL